MKLTIPKKKNGFVIQENYQLILCSMNSFIWSCCLCWRCGQCRKFLQPFHQGLQTNPPSILFLHSLCNQTKRKRNKNLRCRSLFFLSTCLSKRLILTLISANFFFKTNSHKSWFDSWQMAIIFPSQLLAWYSRRKAGIWISTRSNISFIQSLTVSQVVIYSM